MNINNKQILEKLNAPQLEAVAAPLDANLLVLAGAGSGKTRVLIHRIWWLLQQGVDSNSIFAVTFTNKAAQEMRKRLDEMFATTLKAMWIGTFHSLAHRFLRIHWQEASLPQSFQVMDADDQLRLLRRIHKAHNLNEEKWPVKQSQAFINNSKDKCLRPQQLNARHLADNTLIKVYSDYEGICQRSGLVDFSELLVRSYETLTQNPQLLAHYKYRFSHVLVDEFQDTNSIQYLWIRLLAKDTAHLMAVGDDDQSIYSWRGANVENLQQLVFDFPNVKTIRLEQNYRSTGNILSAANAVIAQNKNRLGKNLWTADGQGEPLTLYTAFSEIDEARYIVSSINSYFCQGYQYGDIAILYRSNAQSRVLEAQLTQAQIPYMIYGGLRFYDRAEIKDVLAYLRLTVNKNDDAAFERIINVPTRGIGDTTVILLRDYAKAQQMSMWFAVQEMIAKKMLNNRALHALIGFVEIIENIAQHIDKFDMPELIDYVTKVSGLRLHLAKDKVVNGQGRLENLDELISASEQFILTNSADDNLSLLSLFLSQIFLEATDDDGQQQNVGGSVKLMTLHAAKGLEFPLIFISGMEEGLFPHMMSLSVENGIEEERRLCYVGMTRAMKKLHLVNAESRQVYGTSSFRRPSRFLREIPEFLLEREGGTTRISRPIIANYQFNDSEKIHVSKVPEKNVVPLNQKDRQFSAGQKVFHDKFGEGVVMDFEGDGEKTLIQVKFLRHGTKLLALSVAKLTAL